MARKKKKKSEKEKLPRETVHAVLAIVFFVITIFLSLAAFDKAGVAGTEAYDFLSNLLGVGYFLLPALSFILTIAFVRSLDTKFGFLKSVAALIFFLSGLGAIDLIFTNKGGLVGNWISKPLVSFFDIYASVVLLGALFLISLIIIFRAQIKPDALLFWRRWKTADGVTYVGESYLDDDEDEEDEPYDDDKDYDDDDEPAVVSPQKDNDPTEPSFTPVFTGHAYTPPPLSLLEKDRGKPDVGDIKANANIIRRTFQNFGINIEMDEISIGPSITRYAIKPAEGVRLSRIVGLQNNLELALAAHPVRIEAPIPGKSLVGIEIPNMQKSTIGLASLISSKEFTDSPRPLTIALGKGLSGKVVTAAIDKMPHALIAGATGAGKSVAIHDLIVSLLYKRGPDELKFIMVDPKRVELPLYNGIPHLLTPVITDAKKTILSLKWLTKEMERRYEVLEKASVRDIASYNEHVSHGKKKKSSDGEAPLPYIVVIIDELADIMSSYPRELEAAIVRLAQMSRAVGIHLILSTQRPSVNVITGLIKANIPTRMALQVSSQVDSRTILDMSGAEKLLGAGDMLFVSGDMAKPVRLQSGFISETEVKRVAKYLKKEYGDDLPEALDLEPLEGSIGKSGSGFDDDDDDELYEEARETVVAAGKASTSYLQRKLRVGYARAARLMDLLEERGIIGPADGSRPREVLEGNESDDNYTGGYGKRYANDDDENNDDEYDNEDDEDF